MYRNIGGKIKGLALIFCWLGILASVAAGVYGIITAISKDYNFMTHYFYAFRILDDYTANGIIVSVITIIIGCLISWISSFLLYGFGQLVQNSDRVRESLERYR